MSQRPIDLLPDSVRARSQAGVVTSRYVVSFLCAIGVLVITGTHSRLLLDNAHQRVRVAQEQAHLALTAEAKAREIRVELAEADDFIYRYELVSMPLELSRIIATITNDLPPSATLERLDLTVAAPRPHRSVRSRAAKDEEGPRPRVLRGELNGFAATDRDVAEIVTRLEALNLAERVSLDFSRTRAVRTHGAREFRISFRIDLEARYDVVDRPEPDIQATGDPLAYVH